MYVCLFSLSCPCTLMLCDLCVGGLDGVRKPPGPWKVSDLDIIVDPIAPPPPEPRPGPGAPPSVTGSVAGLDGASREWEGV